MSPFKERAKYKKEQFQVERQISHVTARAYGGEKVYKDR